MVLLIIGTIIGIFFVMRYAEKVKKDPTKSLIYDMKVENEKQFLSGSSEGTEFAEFTTRHKVILTVLLPGLCGDDLRGDPLGRPGHCHTHLVVVVPGDDGLFPVLRYPDWAYRPAG